MTTKPRFHRKPGWPRTPRADTAPVAAPGQSTPALISTRRDLQIFQSLRRITRAIDVHSRKLKSQFKITAPQLVCLLAVANEGPLTATTIARRVFLSASTVVGILDRLEQRGLVRRIRDQRDRRLVRVSATAEGNQLALTAPPPLQDGLARALGQLTEGEQATIADSLSRIGDLMEITDADSPASHRAEFETGEHSKEGRSPL